MNKLKIYIILVLLFIVSGASGICDQRIILENPQISIAIDSNCLISVKNKILNKEYRQIKADYQVEIEDLNSLKKIDSNKAQFNISSPIKGTIDITLDEASPSFEVMITPSNPESVMKNPICFPFPFEVSGEDYLLIPNGSGLIIQGSDVGFIDYKNKDQTRVFPCYSIFLGLSMPWYGVFDENLGSGYIVIYQTPDDARMKVDVVDNVLTPVIEWEGSLNKSGYPRKVRYYFSSEGGYVALSKYYRNYVQSIRDFITLKDKSVAKPLIDKLMGCYFVQAGFVKTRLKHDTLVHLPDIGLGRGLLSFDSLSPENTSSNILSKNEIEDLEHKGAIFADWMVFSDAHLDMKIQSLAYPLIQKDGSVSLLANTWTRLCPTQYSGYMDSLMKKRFKNRYHPPKALMIDRGQQVIQRECYSSEHPCSRKDARRYANEVFKKLSDEGFLIIAEGGADWCVPYVDLAYDILEITKFQRPHEFWYIDKESVIDPPMHYKKYFMGVEHRVPLYHLVYHDCIIGTFHIDVDSNNFFYKTEEDTEYYWDLKDLIQILYGSIPTFHFREKFFHDQKDRIVESVNKVSIWHKKIGYDEMVNHKFLTQDRQVQQTFFSSGKSVIVNFGEESFRTKTGETIKPMDYSTVEN